MNKISNTNKIKIFISMVALSLAMAVFIPGKANADLRSLSFYGLSAGSVSVESNSIVPFGGSNNSFSGQYIYGSYVAVQSVPPTGNDDGNTLLSEEDLPVPPPANDDNNSPDGDENQNDATPPPPGNDDNNGGTPCSGVCYGSASYGGASYGGASYAGASYGNTSYAGASYGGVTYGGASYGDASYGGV